ncbi:hypothetical protein ACFX16_009978 [Malus domestica]
MTSSIFNIFSVARQSMTDISAESFELDQFGIYKIGLSMCVVGGKRLVYRSVNSCSTRSPARATASAERSSKRSSRNGMFESSFMSL